MKNKLLLIFGLVSIIAYSTFAQDSTAQQVVTPAPAQTTSISQGLGLYVFPANNATVNTATNKIKIIPIIFG